jgi:hypothetical protein
VDSFVSVIKKIAQDEGFEVNDAKDKIMRSHKRQWVTGLVVNEEINVVRWKYRQLRAAVHQAVKKGLLQAAKDRKISQDRYRSWVEGNLAFHSMVNSDRALKLYQKWKAVKR